jgi:2'-hydroxyisoflavone reductase
MPGFLNINCQKAIQAGLVFRRLEDTFSSILEWSHTRKNQAQSISLSREKERFLLKQWKQIYPDKQVEQIDNLLIRS